VSCALSEKVRNAPNYVLRGRDSIAYLLFLRGGCSDVGHEGREQLSDMMNASSECPVCS